jgi:hypothetical protein
MIQRWITQPKPNDGIESGADHGALKQIFLRMLDDSQIQQKIGDLLRTAGLVGSTGIKMPQRWYR